MELVGLCYSAVSWLSRVFSQGVYPYSGVKLLSEEGGQCMAAATSHCGYVYTCMQCLCYSVHYTSFSIIATKLYTCTCSAVYPF